VEGIAAAAAQCAEPGIGEFPGGEGIVRARALDIALDAEHPRAALEIVAGLHAADEAARLGPGIVDAAPGVAEIAAEIGAGPAIGVERLVDRVGLVAEVGRLRRNAQAGCDRRDRAQHKPGHRYSPPTPLTP